MKIRISVFGPVKNPFGKGELELKVNKGSTVHALLTGQFKYSDADIHHLVLTLNSKRIDPSAALSEGDHLNLFLPVGGG